MLDVQSNVKLATQMPAIVRNVQISDLKNPPASALKVIMRQLKTKGAKNVNRIARPAWTPKINVYCASRVESILLCVIVETEQSRILKRKNVLNTI